MRIDLKANDNLLHGATGGTRLLNAIESKITAKHEDIFQRDQRRFLIGILREKSAKGIQACIARYRFNELTSLIWLNYWLRK